MSPIESGPGNAGQLGPGPAGPAGEDRLRLLVVSLAREVWGSENSMLALQPRLGGLGIDATLAAPPGAFARRWVEAGGEHRRLVDVGHTGVVDQAGSASPRRAARDAARALRGARLIKAQARGFDVVHVNSLLLTIDCGLARRMGGARTVIEVHDVVRTRVSRALLTASIRLSDAAVAISTAVAATVGRAGRGRTVLLPQGVDTALFAPAAGSATLRRELTARPDGLLVAVIGRLDPAKGAHVVAEACAAATRAGTPCSLVVIGSPSAGNEAYGRQTQEAARALLGDRVRFLPTRQDIPAVLRNVDVLVNASAAEPFGLSVLEAQAAGVPVLASDAGGLPDFVDGVRTGLLAAPGDPAAFARQLGALAAEPRLRAELGRGGRQQAIDRYSLDRRAGALAALYRSVARASPPPATTRSTAPSTAGATNAHEG